jgi:hypothetical protein
MTAMQSSAPNDSELCLDHDLFKGGERFVDYLAEYRHGLMVLNSKEAGIEDEVLRLHSARFTLQPAS